MIPPIQMWVIIIRERRSQWMAHSTIARTRAEAWIKIGEIYMPEHVERNRRNGTFRAIKVDVIPLSP